MAERKTNLVEKNRVEPNTMKRRMVLLWKLLYDQTDEDHPVTTYDIVDYMAEHGIKVSRKTIKPDVDLMVECGFDIVTVSGKPNKYFWGSRELQVPELKLLLDAVSSSRFLTKKKSDDLKNKLTGLASVHQRKQLSRHIYTTNVVKPRNETIYYIVDRINDAIEAKQKISFNIVEFDGRRRKTLRNDGEVYIVSPYALYWNDDFYYVVGWSDKHADVSAFRADRMDNLEILDEKAAKRPKGFRISDYSHKVFEMFDGEEVTVKLQSKNHLMKYVIDRFGDKFSFEPGDDDTFICEVEVCLSPTFYGWVFGFGGEIRILSPKEAVQSIVQMSEDLITAEKSGEIKMEYEGKYKEVAEQLRKDGADENTVEKFIRQEMEREEFERLSGTLDFEACKEWKSWPEERKQLYLNNAYCHKCGVTSFAPGYNIRKDKNGIVVEGVCKKCGEKIVRCCD